MRHLTSPPPPIQNAAQNNKPCRSLLRVCLASRVPKRSCLDIGGHDDDDDDNDDTSNRSGDHVEVGSVRCCCTLIIGHNRINESFCCALSLSLSLSLCVCLGCLSFAKAAACIYHPENKRPRDGANHLARGWTRDVGEGALPNLEELTLSRRWRIAFHELPWTHTHQISHFCLTSSASASASSLSRLANCLG